MSGDSPGNEERGQWKRFRPRVASGPRKVTAVNMMGMMDQAHTLLHQLMMWLHQMNGMPMMNMPM
ncbi:hypothetical protein KI427_00935 [Rhodococcus ruber]|nr:hypothetical protein YT1_0287 [Rhodococcus ruber]MCF8784610.1 hypothetical protein [Rhodococcus ruber]UQB73053.1 hypothetical protein KI427_00935 [Rhodococcus ruber]CCW11101.1 hypothetical protein EBESD8_16370 [Rhodococcus aetherivorans]